MTSYTVENYHEKLTNNLCAWRNQGSNESSVNKWGRRFAVIIPLALLGVVSLIKAAISLPLTLITAPLLLCGHIGEGCTVLEYAPALFGTLAYQGIKEGVHNLTTLQFNNLTKDTLPGPNDTTG